MSVFFLYEELVSLPEYYMLNSQKKIFLVAPWHMEFPGQGSDPSCSFDLSHSCSNAESSTHCAGPGTKPASQSSQDDTNPFVPLQELPEVL